MKLFSCGILVYTKSVIIVRDGEEWVLPNIQIAGGDGWDEIKTVMKQTLNVDVKPFHQLRPHEHKSISTIPHVCKYESGTATLNGYDEVDTIDKKSFKPTKIARPYRDILTTFFHSYWIFLR